jgi:O-Antigen ligase
MQSPPPLLASTPKTSSILGLTIKMLLMAMLMGGASIVALSSSGYPIDLIWFQVRYGLVGLPFVVFMAVALLKPIASTQSSISPLLWIWLGFGSIALLSGLVNENVKGLSDGAWFLIGVPSLFFYVLPRALGRSIEAATAWGLILGHLPYFIGSLVQSPPTVFPYAGMFTNSNQLGVTMLTINCGLLILLNKTLLEPSTSSKLLKLSSLGGGILICFTFILFSNSRTSLLGSLLGLGLAIYPALSMLQQPRFLMRLLLVGIGVISITLLYWGSALASLWQGVESGYTDKLESSDTFNGRGAIWQKTFEDTRMFGYGSNDYFVQNFDLGGHNSLIDILGQSGLIAFYLMIMIALMGLYSAYRYFRSQVGANPYAIAPLLIGVMFWTVAMAESMFGSLGRGLTVAYLLSLGTMLYYPVHKHNLKHQDVRQGKTSSTH